MTEGEDRDLIGQSVPPSSAGANFAFLLIGQAVYMVAGFIAAMRVAKCLGPYGFGQINLSLALVSYVGLFSNFGLATWGARQVAQDASHLGQRVRDITFLRIGLWAVGVIAMGVPIFLIGRDTLFMLFLLYAMASLPAAFLPDWALKGIRAMKPVAAVTGLQALANLGLIVLWVTGKEDVAWVPFSLLVSSALGVGMLAWVLSRRCQVASGWPKRTDLRLMLRESWPLAFSTCMSLLIFNGDTLTLGALRTSEEVGYYNASYRIIALLLAVLNQYFGAAFPVLARCHASSQDEFEALLIRTLRHMAALGLPVGIFGSAVAKDIVALIFGESYGPAVPALSILLWAFLLIAMNSAFSQGLIAEGRQRALAKVVFGQTVFVLLLNIPAVKFWGIRGAALATLAGEILSFFAYFWLHSPQLSLRPLGLLLRAAASGTLAFACFAGLRPFSLPLSLAVGLSVYGLLLLGTRMIASEDWAALRQAGREIMMRSPRG